MTIAPRAIPERLSRMLRHLSLDRCGSTAVEFGMLAPGLMLVLVGTVEFGRLLWTQSALNYGVEEAARCASVNTSACGTSSQITAYAAARASCSSGCSSDFTYSSASCGNKVTVSYPFVFMFKFASITLSAQSCFPT